MSDLRSQTKTSDKHARYKSLPCTLHFKGPLGFLPPEGLVSTSITLTHQTSMQKAVIFFLLHSCLPCSCAAFLSSFSSCHVLVSDGLQCSLFAFSRNGPTPLPIPSQVLHAGLAINSGNVLVLKARKTKHPVSAEWTSSNGRFLVKKKKKSNKGHSSLSGTV